MIRMMAMTAITVGMARMVSIWDLSGVVFLMLGVTRLLFVASFWLVIVVLLWLSVLVWLLCSKQKARQSWTGGRVMA